MGRHAEALGVLGMIYAQALGACKSGSN